MRNKLFTFLLAIVASIGMSPLTAHTLNNPIGADGRYIVKYDCVNGAFANANDMEVDETFVFAVDVTGTWLEEWLIETPSAVGVSRGVAFNNWTNYGLTYANFGRLKQINGNIWGMTCNFSQVMENMFDAPKATMPDSVVYVYGHIFGFEYTEENRGVGWWMWGDQEIATTQAESSDCLFAFAPYTGTKTSANLYANDYVYGDIYGLQITGYAAPCLSCLTASGTCGAEGDNLTWMLSCDSVLTISGTGAMEDYSVYAPWSSSRSTITSVVINAGVTSIGDDAFMGCSSLTSIEIPNSVTSIGSRAFQGCSALTSINVANDNPNYCTIDGVLFNKAQTILFQYPEGKTMNAYIIPNSVTSIGWDAFYYCSSLTSVTIPNSVTSIGNRAFIGCRSLTSVTIPNSVTSIGSSAFENCTSLTSVTIPNSVTSIGSSAFYRCSSLTSVTIPNSVTSIGNYAFSNCSGLTSIQWDAVHCTDFTTTSTPFYYYSSSANYSNFDLRSQITSFTFGDEVEYIPAYLCAGMNKAEITITNCKTEIGVHALDNCTYTTEGTYNIVLPDTTLCYSEDLYMGGVKCPLTKKANTKQPWTLNLKTTERCDSIVTINVTWQKLTNFTITTKHEYDTRNSGSISYKKDDANYSWNYYYTLNGVKNASCSNLSAGNYRLVFYSEECGDSIVKNITINQYGMKVGGMYYLLNETNHTATLTYRGTSYSDYSGEYSGNITIPKTITFDGKEYQVTGINSSTFDGCNSISTITMESETPISMYSSGLSSNCIIYVPYGSLNAYKSASGWKNYTIHVINPSHATTTTGATSAKITLGNTDEAKHISSCGMEGGEEEFAGNIIEYIGLEPNSEYVNIPLFIKTKEGDMDNTTVSFSTTALELTTKASKPVSSTTAILLAETNMSDAEVSCGFEYKRNDAPDDMAGTKVFCPVASGQMAGRLKNLKDDVYYKYRAFYQSAAGNMYYGDWQYIFTGDVAVEFDPILYTYGATVVRENEATISGYALAGSEDFTEQGFEYWAEERANGGANAPRRMPAAIGEHHYVQASGISLRVTLTNLDAGTVYKYRVYGKVGDQYYYGSEQSFTTTGTYTPPTYTITFANWDGTELQSSQVEENKLPNYTGETPTRPEDEQYTYFFSGWTPAIVLATADATYTATYAATPKSQGIEEVPSDQVQSTKATKILRDGQIYILRGEKVYTLQGQEVK